MVWESLVFDMAFYIFTDIIHHHIQKFQWLLSTLGKMSLYKSNCFVVIDNLFRFLYDDINSGSSHIWPRIRINELFRIFYLSSVGLWLSSLLFSFTETRRSDTTILQFHHVVTSILIYVSHVTRVHRIGIVRIFS